MYDARALAGTIPLDRSCLLDLLSQEPRPSLVTGLELARASLTPRIAEASAAQSLPSQLNRYSYATAAANDENKSPGRAWRRRHVTAMGRSPSCLT